MIRIQIHDCDPDPGTQLFLEKAYRSNRTWILNPASELCAENVKSTRHIYIFFSILNTIHMVKLLNIV